MVLTGLQAFCDYFRECVTCGQDLAFNGFSGELAAEYHPNFSFANLLSSVTRSVSTVNAPFRAKGQIHSCCKAVHGNQ